MDDKKIFEKAQQIITEKVHGIEFYNKEMMIQLISELEKVYTELNLPKNMSQEEKIKTVASYVKNNVNFRKEYLNRDKGLDSGELVYRTAYATLKYKEAVCAGFVEAIRIILSLYDINSYTLLAQLPETNKDMLHYVAVAECIDNEQKKPILIDIEREALCEKKGIDFDKYIGRCIYTIPTPFFYKNKISNNGKGPDSVKYLENVDIPRSYGTKEIEDLIKKIDMEKSKIINNEER